jgi:hypothetical protein
MSRKLYALLLPTLAIAAMAISAGAAQAHVFGTCAAPGPKEAPCPGVEKFTEFAPPKRVAITNKKVAATAAFKLVNAAGNGIECTEFQSSGFVWNIGGVGHSHEVLAFEGCTGLGELKGCEFNPLTGAGIIEGVVTDVLNSAGNEEFTITEGFNVKCKTPTEEKELGNVSGTITGTISGNTVTFTTAATGLKFGGVAVTLAGEAEAETVSGKKVFVK